MIFIMLRTVANVRPARDVILRRHGDFGKRLDIVFAVVKRRTACERCLVHIPSVQRWVDGWRPNVSARNAADLAEDVSLIVK